MDVELSCKLGHRARQQDLAIPTTCAAVSKRLLPATVASVVLVGAVSQLRVGHCYSDFVLDDSTGRIAVRLFHGRAVTPGTASGLPSGYVQVVGELSTATPQYVTTSRVRGIASADEISYHFIETAFTSLHICSQ